MSEIHPLLPSLHSVKKTAPMVLEKALKRLWQVSAMHILTYLETTLTFYSSMFVVFCFFLFILYGMFVFVLLLLRDKIGANNDPVPAAGSNDSLRGGEEHFDEVVL